MKKLLITHTDLDGISPIILMKLCDLDFDYHQVEASEIDEAIEKILKEDLSVYDQIFITDLCPKEELVKEISQREDHSKFKIFDHHISRDYLVHYDFATFNTKECGTSLFYEYLKNQFNLNKPIYEEYVIQVLDLDMWYWKEKNNLLAVKLGNLLNLYGTERFIEKMYDKLKNEDKFELSDFENELLQMERERIERYVKKKQEQLCIMNYDNHKVGVVFSNQYTSELGNELGEANPELDYIAMINISGGVSFRTIKDDVDLSVVATKLGGGGHHKASGFRISQELKENIITQIFRNAKIEHIENKL